jgi:hypothetical protein
MKSCFVTYADEKYAIYQKALKDKASTIFDKVFSFNRDWLVKTDFYKENSKILDQSRGGGYWIWKPYVILESFKELDYGDIIFYTDAGDTFKTEITLFLKKYFTLTSNDSILTAFSNIQKDFTKRDCFILMKCDESKYHNANQLEAGNLAFKKTDRIISVLEEWLKFCKNEHIVTDIPCIHGKNFPTFRDHRHDQSILTNLAIKHNLHINNHLAQYITGNVYS